MNKDFEQRMTEAVESILNTTARKIIILAGPGAGKTTAFKKILQRKAFSKDDVLVLTFINNLKSELEKDLGNLARVYTFHGYCRHLLHYNARLRGGLSDNFYYYPPLPYLIMSDWEIIRGNASPHFIATIRARTLNDDSRFFLERANYYDATGFDDSVFRVYLELEKKPGEIDRFELVLVDEYQDFNRLEAGFIDLLGKSNPIIIAGDDDQALYSVLRGSSPEFLRNLTSGGEFERHELPFCMRCTSVIVEAIKDIVKNAQELGNLQGRVDKTFEFYPPRKAEDSEQYPFIKIVQTSVQTNKANYFGAYIEEQIRRISETEVKESLEGNFPTVMIIGSSHYLRQLRDYLDNRNILCEGGTDVETDSRSERWDGLKFLKENPESNLGWRIILEVDRPPFTIEVIRKTFETGAALHDELPKEYVANVLREAEEFAPEEQRAAKPQLDDLAPLSTRIKLTTFEGSKGLSAQHVFIIGMHEGEIPRNKEKISDLEICKFIVGLTRTRKQCQILYSNRWSGQAKSPSIFIHWISSPLKQRIWVDKNYWK